MQESKPLSNSRGYGKMHKALHWDSTDCATSSSRSQICPGFPVPIRTLPQSCNSTDSNPRLNCAQLIFHNSLQSIQLIAGLSGDLASATDFKPEETTPLLAGRMSKPTLTSISTIRLIRHNTPTSLTTSLSHRCHGCR